jgi:hypothetical protein
MTFVPPKTIKEKKKICNNQTVLIISLKIIISFLK